VAITASATILALPTYAQRGPGRGGGWGSTNSYVRMYNPATVETVKGEVVSMERFSPGKGMGAGIHLMLKTETNTIPVHLGPSWFIDNQDTKIEPGDKIAAKGSLITFDGKPAIIAAEVRKGDEVLKLRDDAGIPAWAGWRRR